jgi:cbb3-type cytochrome oxidase maturation protein
MQVPKRMNILILLIPLSVVLVFVIAVLFWWSLRNGQLEDLEGPAYRILMDDDRPPGAAKTSERKDAEGSTKDRAASIPPPDNGHPG